MKNYREEYCKENGINLQDFNKYSLNNYSYFLEKQLEAISVTSCCKSDSDLLKAVEKLKDFAYEVCPLHRQDDLEEIVGSL